jgi:hypothetical protein
MHGYFSNIWQDFANEGIITQAEFENTNFPNHYRSLEEYLLPFDGSAGDARATAAVVANGVRGKRSFEGLELEAADYGEVRCPYYLGWLNECKHLPAGRIKEAAKLHANEYVPTTRTWSNSTFESGLSRGRSSEERAEIVDTLFQRYSDAVAAAPEDHAMDYLHAYMMIGKPLA